MPPRKSQSPGVQGSNAGAAGAADTAGAASGAAGKDDGGKRKHAKLDTFPLTNDEKNFLNFMISQAGSTTAAALTAATKGKASMPTGITPAGKQLLDETWWTDAAMPKFVTITEKVLSIAAEQYHTNHKDYVPPSNRPGDSASGAAANNASATVVPSGQAAQAAAANAPPPPPAGSPAQFAEENTYLVEQLRQLPQCPFTVERLAEILADPYQYHTTKDGKLKPEALQASLRRCILVTYPVIASVNNYSGNEE